MQRFILRFSAFILISIFLLIAITLVTNALVRNKAVFKLSKPSAYLVLGDSHPECAINDSLITDLSNYAQSGESYFYGYFKLKGLIESNPEVKVVFLEFGNGQLEPEMDNWIWSKKYLGYKYIKYAPFLETGDMKILCARNLKDVLSDQSLIFSRNFKMITKGKYNLTLTNDLGGYQHLVRDKTDSLLSRSETLKKDLKISSNYSETNLNYLDKCISYCKSKNIALVLLRCPIHPKELELSDERKFQALLHTRYSHVPFIDFKDFPLSTSDYADLSHLNYKGSRKFSVFFNDLLKKDLVRQTDMQEFINKEITVLNTPLKSTLNDHD